jgi:FKBP-type peptidyl-prolyl cis-trans isomerase FklB
MLKISTPGITVLAAGLVLLGSATAQQSGNTQTPPPGKNATAQSQQPPAASSPNIPALPTDKDKISYAIGMNIGKGLHKDDIEVDPNLLLRGLKDGLSGGQTLMTDDQVQSTMTQLQGQLRQKMEAQRAEAAETNKKEGDAFLAANKTKPGVVALPSGLQYKVLTQGTGPKPTASDTVTCNYRGTLINGTEFDSSAKHGGQPATFPVSGVIKGWTEALQLMPVGSKWQLYIPPTLAYGPRGAGGDIGPDATLIFDVELVSIAPPKDQNPASPPASK